jgi:hypothetical protein
MPWPSRILLLEQGLASLRERGIHPDDVGVDGGEAAGSSGPSPGVSKQDMERERRESDRQREFEAWFQRWQRELPGLRERTDRGIENLRRIVAGKRPIR